MLEAVSLFMSLFLFIYGIRMLVFVCVSRKYRSKPVQITHQSTPQPMMNMMNIIDNFKNDRHVTNNENIILSDNVRKQILETNVTPNYISLHHNDTAGSSKVPESRISTYAEYYSFPVVSLLVATRNEESVIGKLLKSLQMLTYDRSRFEVIVVDDSTDSTLRILEEWTNRIENLKIIKRSERIGWKGGALNLALEYLRKDSSWALILDADMIVPPNIIEEFFAILFNSKKICNAIQGYCTPYNSYFYPSEISNWVSKGVEFRLAQRNMVEFAARDKLNLPVQITGSLFMIKSSILKEIGFSTDLCEDWDLTLQLYLREHDKINSTEPNNNSKLSKTNILFDGNLNAGCQMPTSFSSYFKQRVRVSEGHTRGFFKMIPTLIKHKQPLKNKVEIFLTGMRYLKYAFILSLLLVDLYMLILLDSKIFNIYSLTSYSIQLFCLFSFIIANLMGIIICNRNGQYDFTCLLSKLFLDICTLPALIIGSLLGILRNKGTFHKTRRISNMQISK
jgi:cellulose synthase/poly-beta-1,6-N-acetylglucosamine synthase-like glycosyltransferase